MLRLSSLIWLVSLTSTPAATRLTLRDAVVLALNHNLDIQAERLNLASSLADLNLARAEFDPAFRLGGEFRESRSPTASSQLDGAQQLESNSTRLNGGITTKLPTGATLGLETVLYDRRENNSSFSLINPEFGSSVQLSLRQPLLKDAWLEVNMMPTRLAKLSVSRSNLALQVQALEVMRQTELAYWLVAATAKALDIRRQGVELAERIRVEMQARVEVGLASPRLELLEAQAGAALRRENLISAEKELSDAYDQLFRVIGTLREREKIFSTRPELDPLPEAFDPPHTVDYSFRRAVKYAPAALLQKNREEEREMLLKNARHQRLPGLDLIASSGFQGRGLSNDEAREKMRERNGYFWQVGFEFRMPWASRAERARLEKARVDMKRALLDTKQFELGLYANISTNSSAARLATQRIKATEASFQFTQQKLEAQLERQKPPMATATTRAVLEAQQEAEEAALRLLQARIDAIRAVTSLAQLDGSLPERYQLSLPAAEPSEVE